HGFDVEAAARRPRGAGRRHGGARGARRRDRMARHPRRRGGLRPGDGDNPDWEHALTGLGRDFHITRMTFKNHACCGHTFAAIDGALALKVRMGVQPAEIDRIDVGTYRAGVEVAHYAAPRTPAEARFSLRYV